MSFVGTLSGLLQTHLVRDLGLVFGGRPLFGVSPSGGFREP